MAVIEIEPVQEKISSEEIDVEGAFLRAEAWMREHGWTRGRYETPDGAVCVYGAIYRGVFGTSAYLGRKALPVKIRLALFRVVPSSLAAWNDNICSGEDEALAMLARARRNACEQED